MIIALEVEREVDLALFSRYLTQLGVFHRISEEGDLQVVRVRSESEIERVRTLYDQLARGEIKLESRPLPASAHSYRARPLTDQFRQAWLTTALIVITFGFYPATFGLDSQHVSDTLKALTFVGFEEHRGRLIFETLQDTFESGEYWRFISPMFLHFSLLHIVFNLLWIWEIGRRIEIINGRLTLLLLVLVTSLWANFLQYFMSGPSLFGGMSGVVFGLLGFSLVWSRLVPGRSHGLPSGVYIFMLVFMVAGFMGVFDWLLAGSVANGAHLGGFLGGLCLGLLGSWIERPAKTA